MQERFYYAVCFEDLARSPKPGRVREGIEKGLSRVPITRKILYYRSGPEYIEVA